MTGLNTQSGSQPLVSDVIPESCQMNRCPPHVPNLFINGLQTGCQDGNDATSVSGKKGNVLVAFVDLNLLISSQLIIRHF